MINLEKLSLVGNHLRMLPADIGRLTQLRSLRLSRNRLKIESIPYSLTFCEKLEKLYLDNNSLGESTTPDNNSLGESGTFDNNSLGESMTPDNNSLGESGTFDNFVGEFMTLDNDYLAGTKTPDNNSLGDTR